MITTFLDFFQKQAKVAADNGKEISVVKQLMLHVTGTSPVAFISSLEALITEDQQEKFFRLFDQYLNGKPVGYILQEAYFYGHVYHVNPSVLIPRMETEELMEWVLYHLRTMTNPVVADIGTGSGNIAITVKKYIASSRVLATDISLEALQVARQNATNLQTDIEFYQGDFLKPLINQNIKVDVVISNPPYVSETDDVDPSVLQYEPRLALFADDNGLASYKAILADVKKVLNPKGKLFFEIGASQKEAVSELIKQALPNSPFTVEKDMSGNDRIVIVDYRE